MYSIFYVQLEEVIKLAKSRGAHMKSMRLARKKMSRAQVGQIRRQLELAHPVITQTKMTEE